VIVAGEGNDAAVARRARRIGVLERVHRAVDARALAVPDAEDTIDLGARIKADCWLPQTAVAARFSLRPGTKAMSLACRCDLARHKAWSYIPSGEPR
jgi:hypothetical protein